MSLHLERYHTRFGDVLKPFRYLEVDEKTISKKCHILHEKSHTVIHKDWFVKKLVPFQKIWFFENNTNDNILLCQKLIYETLSVFSTMYVRLCIYHRYLWYFFHVNWWLKLFTNDEILTAMHVDLVSNIQHAWNNWNGCC